MTVATVAAQPAKKAAAKKTAAKKTTRARKPQPTPAQEARQRYARRERRAQVRSEERTLGRTPTEQREASAAQSRARQARARRAARSAGRDVARTAQTAQITPGNRSYQGAILAEYLAALILVTLSPIASGGSPDAKAKNSPSPYSVNDMRQLVAVSAVYFVLAIMSSGDRFGRAAAWFGGLVLITVGVSKLGQGQLQAVFSVVGQQPGQGAAGAAGTAAGQAGQTAAQQLA